MKKAGILSLATFVIAACMGVAIAASTINHNNAVYEKTFSQKFSGIVIENADGRTEVETWNSNRIRVAASREGGQTDLDAIESRLRFEINTTDLRIVVRGDKAAGPINLSIFVPRQINLAVRGDTEAITVRGATSALSVETQSGSISLYLPNSANSDLSLRSIEGTITSQLEMRVFGPVNAHSLDGRLGRGGAPIILRSLKGALTLLADDAGRIARADARATGDASGIGTQPLMNTSSFVATNAALDTSSANKAGGSSGSSPGVGATTQDDPPVADIIKIDTRLVNLNVRVTDTGGKLITDLTQADFQIFEDSVEQAVVRFEPVTSPVSVVILLDASGSTKERWKVIKKAAKKFIDTLNPNTPIAVAAFTRKFLVICDFSCDRKLMKDRIDDTKNLESGTAFYDATWSALNLFKEIKEQRKAIVVMTDGVDNSLSDQDYEPRHPFDELLARISQEEVTIYPIYFDTEFQVVVKMRGSDTHESYVTARQQLNKIADETGGTLFKADRAEDLEGVYKRVASELQTIYSVSYNPADKNYNGSWRNVGVKIKRDSAQARTKRGFYAK